MKIRNSFVSNSSSSSFVIRGGLFTTADLLATGVPVPDEDDAYAIKNFLKDTFNVLFSVETTRYYFGGDPTHEFIIGKETTSLDDGVVMELPETDDDAIMKDFKKTGLPIEKLKTFVQFVSNDNY